MNKNKINEKGHSILLCSSRTLIKRIESIIRNIELNRSSKVSLIPFLILISSMLQQYVNFIFHYTLLINTTDNNIN